MPRSLLLMAVLLATRALAEPPAALRACRADADCTLRSNCTYCNQCLSRTAPRLEVDCKAECLPRTEARCVCLGGLCALSTTTPTAPTTMTTTPSTPRTPPMPPRPPPTPTTPATQAPDAGPPARLGSFLLVRDGAQCRLQRDAARVAEEERRRLAAHGLDVRDVRVAFMLRDDVLPKRCLPKDAEAFFAAHPRAREGLVKATGAVCEACGCPEPWFFCAEAAAPPEAMKRAGYAPLP